MQPVPDLTRARHDALNLPLDQIRWRHPRHRLIAGIGTFAAVTVAGIGLAYAAPPRPRLAPDQTCAIVTIAAGDTVWAVAEANHLTLDRIAALNPQIDRLDLVYPGDQISVGCAALKPAVVLAPAVTVTVAEMQHATTDPTAGLPPWPGFNKWIPAGIVDGVASQPAVLDALWRAGARGNQLITLAAITEGESNRRIAAIGDVDMQTGVYGPSVGIWQIRTLKADTGKGTTRDAVRAATLDGGARSAIELWDQAQARGQDPGSPWTCYQLGNHRSFVEPYRTLATRMGFL